MGRKSPYPEEFRKGAVALYRAAGGKRTSAAVAADLGITVESRGGGGRQDNKTHPQPPRPRGAGGAGGGEAP
ncbi:IS3 family transposase, partial [Streptomyces mirabilis]